MEAFTDHSCMVRMPDNANYLKDITALSQVSASTRLLTLSSITPNSSFCPAASTELSSCGLLRFRNFQSLLLKPMNSNISKTSNEAMWVIYALRLAMTMVTWMSGIWGGQWKNQILNALLLSKLHSQNCGGAMIAEELLRVRWTGIFIY